MMERQMMRCVVVMLILVPRFELGLGWFGDYDGYDIAALTVLSHGPPVSF